MEFINRFSTSSNIDKIAEELTRELEGPYDLGFLFISTFNKTSTAQIVEQIKKKAAIKNLLGCSCTGVISTYTEVENQPACSLFLAKFPDTKIKPFYLNQDQFEQFDKPEDLYKFLEVYPAEKPKFLLLPDPFLLDMNGFLKLLNQSYPDSPVIGGLASAASKPRENILIFNDSQHREGVVGVVLTGNIHIETVVSQGCRPIGETYIVTKAKDNIIHEVAGQPFFEVLEKVFQNATDRDRLLAQEAIFVGIVMDEYKHPLKRGDFLIRVVMGVDQKTGAGAIADYVQPGQTIQFHVRDADTATEDLNDLLGQKHFHPLQTAPKGMLIFSCTGRGQGLFGEKDHDIKIIQNHVGPIPGAGFFCAGEIGPVGCNNFLHGFTSSIALFYPQQKTEVTP